MIDIEDRLELLVDDALISCMSGVELRLHEPTRRDVCLTTDAPWEGNNCGYFTVFRDGDRYRMYYRTRQVDLSRGKLEYVHQGYVCYTESRDGVTWEKPELGLIEFQGSARNNIVWTGSATHNFTPFKDANPGCSPEARYKALGGTETHDVGLVALKSADGIHWSHLRDKPVITQGKFDSQNLAFWDTLRNEYREYHRQFDEGRDIMTCTSQDFETWTEPEFIEYVPGRLTQLYTNQIIPYYRAPHIFLGFPTRYVAGRAMLTELNERIAAVNKRFGTDYTDGGFMTSRDARRFHMWGEAFLRPGPVEQGRWVYGGNYQNWGIVETPAGRAPDFLRPLLPDIAPRELTVYATEGGWFGSSRALRRHTLRVDGFVSAHASSAGGELITEAITFTGGRLILNFATSAAGSVRVEVQEARTGRGLEGFRLDECEDVFGDEIERTVRWTGGGDLGRLAGQPVRLRFALRDADLYSYRFQE